MSADHSFTGEVTQYGFTWGPLEVVRVMSDGKYGVVIYAQTEYDRLEIRATPGGRKLEYKHTTRKPKEETST